MSAPVKTPVEVTEGTWSGHLIRRARKPSRCDYWHGLPTGKCKNRIEAGDLYMEGEMNDRAGGYGKDRYCIECAGPGAAAALATAADTMADNDAQVAVIQADRDAASHAAHALDIERWATESGYFAQVFAQAFARHRIAATTDLHTELDCREGDLVMLRRAIEEGDPKAELLFRIEDMLRETRAALAKARGQ